MDFHADIYFVLVLWVQGGQPYIESAIAHCDSDICLVMSP